MRRRGLLTFAVLLAAVGAAGFYGLTIPETLPREVFTPRTPDLANGETLFNAGNCASCHATPGGKTPTNLGGGYAMQTPFGTFKAPNISTHPRYGIGSWTEVDFANAMLKGVGKDGEHLYPAFPYVAFQHMKLDDVRDLYAYMKTLPQVAKASEPHQLSFPFTFRRGLGLWKHLHLDGKPFVPDPSKSAEINRGAYLVEALAHCAECHSPRDITGGIPTDRRYAGGPNPSGKGWIPNITPHETGIKSWSAKDIAYLLETGQNPEFDSVGSSMAAVVENTAKLSAADRQAMAAYLVTLPPRDSRKPK